MAIEDPRLATISPVMSETWHADSLDPRAVERSLARLWERKLDERRAAGLLPASAPDTLELRTSTVNLIAVAGSADEAARAEAMIATLRHFAPTRAVVLCTDSAVTAGLELTVAVREIQTERGRVPVRFEVVRAAAGPGNDISLASIASPLLVPELPTFVWWPGETVATSDLLPELMAIADRFIVDSAAWKHPGRGLRRLARHIGVLHGPILSDFAWARLRPWRSLLAQFFDHPDTIEALESLVEVEIVARITDDGPHAGSTSAVLLAGWLGSVLGWRVPGPLVRTREGWRVTLRAGDVGAEREVLLRFVTRTETAERTRLLGISLRSETPAGEAHFIVRRTSEEMIETASALPGATTVVRRAPVRLLSDAVLAAEELAEVGRDTIFEQAFAFAVALIPEEN